MKNQVPKAVNVLQMGQTDFDTKRFRTHVVSYIKTKEMIKEARGINGGKET